MSKLDDIRQRSGSGVEQSWLSQAERDRLTLLATVDAVLALADDWKKEFTGHSEGESMLRAAAYMVRAAVNDAVEAGK